MELVGRNGGQPKPLRRSLAPEAFQGDAFQATVDPEDFLERYKQLTPKQKRVVLLGLGGVAYSLWQVAEKLNEHPTLGALH